MVSLSLYEANFALDLQFLGLVLDYGEEVHLLRMLRE